MTERTVTIRLALIDEIGGRLKEVKRQIDTLAKGTNISLGPRFDPQAQAQIKQIEGNLKGVSTELQKQSSLAKTWSSSVQQGVAGFSKSIENMLSRGGSGFSSWIKDATRGLEQYRTSLEGTSIAMLGFGLAAARSYKIDQNLQKSVLSHLGGKISDQEIALTKKWLDQASKADWSQGQTARLEVYKNVLNKTRLRGEAARKATENIEKVWFANQEDLKEHGFESAQALIQAATTKTIRGQTASELDSIFGRGFAKRSVASRINMMSLMGEKTDIESAVAARPEEVLAKRLAASTSAIGQTVVPVLNTILDAFIKISNAIAKIPGLNSILGWGIVLTAAASAGLALVSILGGMISNLVILQAALAGSTLVEYAHTAAMWLGSAAAAARAAVTGVLATVTGLLTGEIALSSIVMAGWNAIMAAGAVVAGIFNLSMLPIIAVLGAAALIIGLVAYKSGLLHSVLKTLSNINLGRVFKDLQKGDFGKAWKDLTKGIKLPQIDLSIPKISKMGIEFLSKAMPFGAILKIAQGLADGLRKIWSNSDYLNKIVSTGLGIWQKMLDFFSWLLGTVRDLQKWLATAIPGAEKEAARKKMIKQGQAEGLRPGKKHGRNVWYTTGKSEGLRGTPSSKLLEMQKEYEDLPGFAEGVAKAVAEGMKDVAKTIGTSVGNAMKSWSPQINMPDISIPGMSKLADAIKKLDEMLSELFQGTKEYAKDKLNQSLGGTKENPSLLTQKQFSYGGQHWGYNYKENQYVVYEIDPVSSIEASRKVDIGSVPPEVRDYFQNKTTKYASGATFLSGGLFKGEVHPTEEIIPQAVTQRGAGPISRMLAIINEASPRSGPGQGRGWESRQAGDVTTNLNIHIDRIEKDVDVDKLLFRIRDELDSHATRTIGYLRG